MSLSLFSKPMSRTPSIHPRLARLLQAECPLPDGLDQRLERFLEKINQEFLALEKSSRSAVALQETLSGFRSASMEELALILDSLPDAILVVDKNHEILVWNRAMEFMTGVPRSAILGRGNQEYAIPFYGFRRPLLLDFIGRDPRPAYPMYHAENTNRTALATEVFVPALYRGRGAFVWAKACPLYDHEGHISGAVQSVRDITEKKRSEICTQLLYHVATAASSDMNEEQVLSVIFTALEQHLDIWSLHVTLDDAQRGRRSLTFHHHAPDRAPSPSTEQRVAALAGAAARSRSTQRMEERVHPQGDKNTSLVVHGICLPILAEEQLLGTMTLRMETSALLIAGDDETHLSALADSIALAITQRMAKTALHHSEQKYRAIFENATEGIFQLSSDLRLANANPALRNILATFGLDNLLTASGAFLEHLLPPSDHEEVMRRVLSTGHVLYYEFGTPTPTGAPAWMSLNLRAVRGPDEEVRHLEGSLNNISARKKAECDVAVQKTLFQQLFENSPQAILLLGPDGTPININSAFTRLFGPDDPADHAILDILVPPDNIKEGYDFLCAVLSGKAQHEEGSRAHSSGRRFPVSILGYPYTLHGKTAGAFLIYSDISERKHYEDKLTKQALRDSLTGLPNRILYMDRLAQAMERQRRSQTRFAVLMIDLDGFKRVNDTLGHQAGDQMLIEIGGRLRACLRSTDTVARLGGDEFALLLEDFLHVREPMAVIRRLLHDIHRPIELMNREITVSASVGVVLNTKQYLSPNDLLRDADISMYRAKERGKNQFRVFNKTMFEQVAKAMRREQDLRQALTNNELELFFQPIFSLPERTLCGFEGLIRWNHPQDGLLGPGEFIMAAEESGLISGLSKWVLREGCATLAKWKDRYPQLRVNLALNLSPRDFAQHSLLSMITELLQTHGINARTLRLEVTETAVMDNPVQATAMLERLQKQGIQIAMDDFGTGYSSLSYLQRLPLDILKIDRSFVRTMLENPSNLEIIRAILGLGKILNLRTVAEGVESEEQLKTLEELGCDHAQGFLLGRPVPLREVTAMLDALHLNLQ